MVYSQTSPNTHYNLYTAFPLLLLIIKDHITLPKEVRFTPQKILYTEFSGPIKTTTTISLFLFKKEVRVK